MILPSNNVINWSCPLNRGLQSWHLNLPGGVSRGGDTFRDLTGRANGTLNNMSATNWLGAENRPGGFGSLKFAAGSDTYVDCGDKSIHTFGDGSSDSPFTISLWCFFDSVSTSGGVAGILAKADAFNNGEYYFFQIDDDLYFRVVDSSAGAYQGRKYEFALFDAAAEWKFLTVTYDGRGGTGAGAGINMYHENIQGSLTDSDGGTYTAMENTTKPLHFGRRGSTADYSGRMDDVRIWNRELTHNEVKEVYYESMSGYRETLSWIRNVDALAVEGGGGGTILPFMMQMSG